MSLSSALRKALAPSLLALMTAFALIEATKVKFILVLAKNLNLR